MPSILTVENISRDFDGTVLFSEVTFGLQEGERVGLIGRNGTGKTTLLRMIAGLEESDTGRIYLSGSPVVGYLPQNPTFEAGRTVLDTIFESKDPRLGLLREYQEVCDALARDGSDAKVLDRMSVISEKMDAADAWSLETEARIILDRFGIDDTGREISTLSGGEQKRVAMAHALLEHPDLLILDEPTNHLDAETITWLENFLATYSGALLLVTHDRYFLERVVTRIVEIDRKGAQSFDGNYSYYLEKKGEQEEQREVEEHKRKQLAKAELAWLRSGAKARRTKQKARIERANELLSRPKEEAAQNVEISLGARRLGKKILEMRGVSKSYGDRKLIADFTHILKPSERVGIIGPNGAGKSTLLEMIVGGVAPDSGEIERGETVTIGYYDQQSRAMADEMRIIDYVKEGAEVVRTADGSSVSASQMLERFLFPKKAQYNLIGNLSGGERRRLYLLRMLMSAPNVLILDEPTNDLDIATLQALEEYLDGFPGPVIIVSHDRWFLDRTIDHLFRFEGDGYIREYPGDYSAFLDFRRREDDEAARIREEQKASQPKKEKPKRENDPDVPKKLSFNEKRELDRLEVEIAEGEEEKAKLESELAAADYLAAPEVAGRLDTLTTELESKLERWAELAERA